MTAPRRQLMIALLLIGGLAALALWSHAVMSRARERTVVATAATKACQVTARELAALRERQRTAELQDRPSESLREQIVETATATGVKAALRRVGAQTERRVPETDYRELSTEVHLRPITLRELIVFLERTTKEPSLTASRMRLWAPRGQETTSAWNAEATLSSLVFSPRK